MTRSASAWFCFVVTRLVGAAIDVAVIGFAYVGALVLRFDFREPPWGWRAAVQSFLIVAVAYLFSLVITGVYRLSWRRTGMTDLPRYLAATVTACVILTVLRVALPDIAFAHIRPPYSVTLISFVLSTVGLVTVRLLWSAYWTSRRREAELLSRQVRTMESAAVVDFFRGKTVMVTGAGGSIGSEIVRQVACAGAARVLLVERGENALYEIDREMRHAGVSTKLESLMVDVCDRDKMESLFKRFRPEIVLHAAAYKHVPMVEMNPEEGWRNNTEATRQLAELAAAYGVRRFVLISTDKAVNPVSVMGQTKRAAEKAVLAMVSESTSFCAVRFGNVFGSSGSVVPLFREQIARHLPVTVTHPEMKRYFMTVSEAVGLVLQAATRPEKAIYTLDMGEPVRIVDLAEGMIRQAGYRPYVDIPVVFTGIRPGEKLFEELDVSENSAYRTDMAKIYINKL